MVVLLAYLIASRAGLIANNPGGDWAQHMALIDSLYSGERLDDLRPRLNELVDTPRVAHLLAAKVADFANISPLQSIHIVGTSAIIISGIALAFRLTLLGFILNNGMIGAVATWIVGIGIIFISTDLTIGFGGQLQYNFFFNHAVGGALALCALTTVQGLFISGRVGTVIGLIAIPFVTFLLTNTHTVPALWFGAAATICVLSLDSRLLIRTAIALLLGAICLTIIFMDPGTRMTVLVGQTGAGDLNLGIMGMLWRLSYSRKVLAIGLVILAMSTTYLAFLKRKDFPALSVLNLHAGALATLAIGLALLIITIGR